MKNHKLWLKLALLLCMGILLTAVLPGSLAYVVSNSNTLHNTFRVEYQPPQDVAVPVHVRKTVQCVGEETIGPEGFSFLLKNVHTGEITAMTSDQEGDAVTWLVFTADDAGKTYAYQLYEENGGRLNVVYDETIYDISISLILDEQHEMSAVLMMNGETTPEITATFVNLYGAMDIPDTGDHDQPLLWLAMLLCSGWGLAMLMLWRKECFRRRLLWNKRRSGF